MPKSDGKKATLKKKVQKKEVSADERDVIYEAIEVRHCQGETALTYEQARELIGWEEESDGVKFGHRYDKEVSSLAKRKVRLLNNLNNRPLYRAGVETLRQEILRKRWKFNGEPLIIGKYGTTANGQHRIVALILAVETWREAPEDYPQWESEPVLETLAVFGVDESDDVINTMDTCKPRTLTEAIFRSSHFDSVPRGKRLKIAKMTDNAVRLLWHRTGTGLDAFASRRTHAESLAFIDAHPRVLEAVRIIHEMDLQKKEISRLLQPGYAAAMFYLMGSSNTDPTAYHKADGKGSEELLDWSLWDEAQDFWANLSLRSRDMHNVFAVLATLLSEGRGSLAERLAIVANAWLHRSEKLTVQKITPKVIWDDEDNMKLDGQPAVGGIDCGDPKTVEDLPRSDLKKP